MQMPHHSNRIRFNPIERWNKYQTGILFQVHSHHINLYSPNKSDSIRSSANPILEPVLNSDLVCDLREELAARTTRRRRLMRSSVRPSYLNTILRRLSERFVRRHMVVLVELVVLLVSPDHPPKRAKATKMKQQHLCANCVTRKGGKWARGSGERIRCNDGHASVVAAAAVFLLFYGSLFATLGGWGKGLKPAGNGQRKMENRACVAVCQLAHVVLVPRSCNLELSSCWQCTIPRPALFSLQIAKLWTLNFIAGESIFHFEFSVSRSLLQVRSRASLGQCLSSNFWPGMQLKAITRRLEETTELYDNFRLGSWLLNLGHYNEP